MTEKNYTFLTIESDYNNPQLFLICGNRREFVAKDSYFLPKINNPR